MNPGLVVKLRPTGPWRIGPDSGARNRVDTIYHSDSLYAAVTSAMALLGSLEDWLADTARQDSSAVRFSSCFPFLDEIGFVIPPRTVWPPTSPALLSAHLRWKSARLVPLGIVQAILSGHTLDEKDWSVDGASECLVPAGRPGPFRTGMRWNAAIDRLHGAAERHSTACIEFRPGAGLWTIVSFAGEAAAARWLEPVKAAFRLLADSGFGGERSRGWGRAEPPEFIEGTLPDMILPARAARETAPAEPEMPAPAPPERPEPPQPEAPEEGPREVSVRLEPVAIIPLLAPRIDPGPRLEGASEAGPKNAVEVPVGPEAGAVAEPEGAPPEAAVPAVAPSAGAEPAETPVSAAPSAASESQSAPGATPEEAEPLAAPEAAMPPGGPESRLVRQAVAPSAGAEPAETPVSAAPSAASESQSAPEAVAPTAASEPQSAPEAAPPATSEPQAAPGAEAPSAGPETAQIPETAAPSTASEPQSAQEAAAPEEAEPLAAPETVAPTTASEPQSVPEAAAPEEVEPLAAPGLVQMVTVLQLNRLELKEMVEAVTPPGAPESQSVPEAVASSAGPEPVVIPEGAMPTAASEPQAAAKASMLSAAEASAEPEPPAASEAAPPPAAPEPTPSREPRVPSPARAAGGLQPHWLLSLFIPGPGDSIDWGRGSYTVSPRGGRVESPSGSGELKKQVQMVTEGSVLYAAAAPSGGAPDVAPDGFPHPVYRAGFALSIPLPEAN